MTETKDKDKEQKKKPKVKREYKFVTLGDYFKQSPEFNAYYNDLNKKHDKSRKFRKHNKLSK